MGLRRPRGRPRGQTLTGQGKGTGSVPKGTGGSAVRGLDGGRLDPKADQL